MLYRIGYNAETGRFTLGDSDLHCGDVITVRIDGEWRDCRLEMNMNDEWYLVGFKDRPIYGLEARCEDSLLLD